MSRPVVLCLVVALAFSGCFGEQEDEDGVEAAAEKRGYEIQFTGPDGVVQTRHVTSSPTKADTDGDGLDDFTERLERTDPRDPDTDDDGLLDGNDVELDGGSKRAEQWRAEGIRHRTTGSGGLLFLGERGAPGADPGGDPRSADTDKDGLLDGEEIEGFSIMRQGQSVTVTTLAYAEDSDGDGLWDGFEREYGTDPTEADMDGDAVKDSVDLDPWRDLHVRVMVTSLMIVTDPEGRSSRDLWLKVQLPGIGYESDVVRLERGVEYSGATLSSGPVQVPDDGGHVMDGRHNLSFAVSALSTGSSGGVLLLDLFSSTGSGSSLFGALDALRGTNHGAPPYRAPEAEWPADDRFEGQHGHIRLHLEPVGPP